MLIMTLFMCIHVFIEKYTCLFYAKCIMINKLFVVQGQSLYNLVFSETYNCLYAKVELLRNSKLTGYHVQLVSLSATYTLVIRQVAYVQDNY